MGGTATKGHEPAADPGGRAPAAPLWFQRAIACEPARTTLLVEGAELEFLQWGAPNRRTILFLPGGQAHADWWSFVAPYFLDSYRVGALSFSGLGNSAHRPQYSYAQHTREALAAIAELNCGQEAGESFVIGHSYGANAALLATQKYADRVSGAILLDPPLHYAAAPPARPVRQPQRTTYATEEEALDRFRLASSDAANFYALEYIARKSIQRTEEGWILKGDRSFWQNMSHEPILPALGAAPPKVALIFGALSELTSGGVVARNWATPQHVLQMVLPEAGHNLMVDQPLALVAAVRAILSTWR